MTSTRTVLVTLIAVGTLALAGCGGTDPETSGTPTGTTSSTPGETPSETAGETPGADGVTVEVTVSGDTAEPLAEQVDLEVGQTLTLSITSDRSGSLHVHSSPEQELEFGAGTTTLTLTFDKPGSVDIEEHQSETLLVRALVR